MKDNAGNMKDLQKSKNQSHEKEYIVPPGLTGGISELQDYCRVVDVLRTLPTLWTTLFCKPFT